MADIRIKDLPLATGGTAPTGTDSVAIDGLTTRKTTISVLGDVAVPIASQAEAETGTDASKRMTPLTVKQSIASEVGATLASNAQGQLADTAVQPEDLGNSAALDIGTSVGTVASGDRGLTVDIISGPQTSNPYAGPYPSYMYGVGGIGYYDITPLKQNALWGDDSSYQFAKKFTYGGIDQATAVSATANSIRPGFIAGFTAPSQVSAYDEFGATALGAQIDSIPCMLHTPGTFTATTFLPTTPITLSDTVRVEIGMWLRSNDDAAFNGQVTGWALNGSGQVTQITVSNWYRRGGGAGTPTGNRAYINPQDKIWGHLNTIFLNKINFTANTTNGSTAVTNISSMQGIVNSGNLISGPGIAPGTTVNSIDYFGNQLFLSKAATATATGATLNVSAGTEFNKGCNAEIDIFNAAQDFVETFVSDTGTLTSGSYVVSDLVLTSQWRPGLIIYGTGPALNYVTSVGYGTNTLRLKYPATITGAVSVIKGINMLDECGVGFDFVSVVNRAQAATVQRGNFYHGYVSHGAVDTSFLVQPDVTAGLPLYGFRVEGRINGMPTTGAFALTNNGVALWKVDGTGKSTAQLTESVGGYTVGNVNVLDNAPWTAFTPVLSSGAGTITTVGAQTGKYKRIGRTVRGVVRSLITTNGTGASFLLISGLPFTNGSIDTPITGRRTDTGAVVTGVIGAGQTSAIVQGFDGGYPGATAGGVNIFFDYEIS